MKYNFKKTRFQFTILLTLLFSFQFVGYSQIVGGRSNSESSPKKVEASKLSGGDFVGDVNLLNGSYNATVPLGTVATPGGVSFSLALEYSSAFSIGGTKPVCSGIPYGEGWDLNLPTISIESDVFHKFLVGQECSENEGFPNVSKINYSQGEYSASDEGDLYWFSPTINIPGVASGKAIFKYVDVADANAVVFVLNKFESPVEIRYYGDAWKILLSDGTQYIFDQHLSNYRAPSNKRILYYDQQVDGANIADYPAFQTFENDEYANKEAIRNVIEAKESYSVWYCSNIRNTNTPLQGVNFNYQGFGNFNYFQEFQQEEYGNVSQNIIGTTSLPKKPNFETYAEILLLNVTSYVMESPVDILELDYKTLNEALEYSVSHNGSLIDIRSVASNSSIGIFDELYSYQNIYSSEGTQKFDNWVGYQHHKFTPSFEDTYNSNPYLSSSGYHRNSYGTGLDQIAFNHSFLESPRITPDMIFPGDIYQVKTKINRSTAQSLVRGNGTVDISIVTGKCDNNALLHSNNFSQFNTQIGTTFPSSSYQKSRGIEIFSTFNMALKWQMGYNRANLETSNFFVMPNIPTSYGGFNIQVGPGNSDLDYSRDAQNNNIEGGLIIEQIPGTPSSRIIEANRAYPFYKAQGAGVRKIKSGAEIEHNFGVGLPWSMMSPIYNSMALGYGSLFGDPTNVKDLYKMWWYNESVGTNSFENIPTKFGPETSLQEVNLVRYTKNPYMLQAVRLYHVNGEMNGLIQTGKKIISQKRLEYSFEVEQIIENYDYQNGQPLVLDITGKKRIIILLDKITEVPLNGDVYAVNYGVDPTTVLTTQLKYSAFYEDITSVVYDQTRPFKGHTHFILTQFIDHLGGITRVTYYDASNPLTKAWDRFNQPNYCDGLVPTPSYGKELVVSIHPSVQYIDKNDENNYLIPSAYPNPADPNPSIANPSLLKRWEYQYEGTIFGRKDYLLPFDHFRTNNVINNDFVGYKTVTVLNPILETGEQNRTEYVYNGTTTYLTSTIEDYLFSGKMASVKTYSNTNVLHDEKIINYEYTLAFKNGYERPNFMRERLVLDGFLLDRSYEYEDIYKNKVVSVTTPDGVVSGTDAYSYIAPNTINGLGSLFERPKMLEFFFYEDLKAKVDPFDPSKFANPEYMFHSYFIKKGSEINRVYENSLSKAGITKPVLPPLDAVVSKNPFGGGFVNPNPDVPNTDNVLKETIAKGGNGLFEKIINMQLSDNVLLYFMSRANYTPTQKHDLLAKQKGLSNNVWIQVVNTQNQFTPDQIKHLINIQSYFSDEILQQVINVSTAETDPKMYEAFLLKNDYLSDPIRKELTKPTHIVPGESFVTIFENQQNLSADVLQSLVNSARLTDANLVRVLKNQLLSEDQFLKIVRDQRFTERSVPELFMETVAYPTDKVLLEVLNKGSQYSDLSYQHIFESSPRELGSDVQRKLDMLFSCEMITLLKPKLDVNPLAKYCGNPVIEGRKYIETQTSYEYYEADYTGKAVGRAYNVLLSIDQVPRTVNTGNAIAGSVPAGTTIYPSIVSDASGNIPATITIDKLYLKHEPSWQLFSTKTSSPHLPGGFSQDEYFYLFDLQNRYDRYWFNYDYTDPLNHFEAQYVTYPSIGVSDILVNNQLFPSEYLGDSETSPALPPLDGMVKSRAGGMRSLAFQKTNFTKNQHDVKPMSRSEYYMYDSRWTFDDFTQSETRIDNTIPCVPLVSSTTPCSNGDLEDCTDCYWLKNPFGNDWQWMISQLPVGYCIWSTNSAVNGGNYYYCPSGTDAHLTDPTAVLVYCSGFEISNDVNGIIPAPHPEIMYYNLPQTRQALIGNVLGRTLQLRSVTIQVDEIPVSSATDPFITHRMSPKNTYVAEFVIGSPTAIDADGFASPYSMVFPYKTLTVRTILKRNRYMQPRLEENQVGLRTRYDYSLAHMYWNINTGCPAGTISSSYSSVVNENIGLPTKITIGDGRSDALVSIYEYTILGLVKKIIEPSGKFTEYSFDNMNRLESIKENGLLLSTIDYKYWNHDNNLHFNERTTQNYINNTMYNSNTIEDEEILKSFFDPLGRNQSNVRCYKDQLGAFNQIHSANVEYDNWGRISKTYKNYIEMGNVINFSSLITLDYISNKYENNPKSRAIRSTDYGVTDVMINQALKSNYNITNNVFTSCELGLTKSELELIMGTGSTINYQFHRTELIDQDGKNHIEYKNAFSQKVATLQTNDNGEKIVTLFGYDSYGNLITVINPKKQITTFEYNMLGQLVKEKTIDAGTKRYMYNKQGFISIMQDEVGRKNLGLDNTLRPFYKIYKYDDYGNLLQEGRTDVTIPYLYSEITPYNQIYDALFYETKFIGESIGVPLEIGSAGDHHIYFDYIYSTSSTQDWLCNYKFGITAGFDGNGNEIINILTHTPLQSYFNIVSFEKEYIYDINPTLNSIGKLISTFSYNINGKKIQKVEYLYNSLGHISQQTTSFNATELIESNPINNIISKIYYPSYNYRGSVLEEKADINGDGIIDIHYLNKYDKLNRLISVSVSIGEISVPTDATLIVSYKYDDATGHKLSTKHFIDGSLSGAPLLNYLANEITNTFDERERITNISSQMGSKKVMNYNLYYNLNDPNQLGTTSNFTQNFNGNINGTSMKYDFSGTETSGSAMPTGFDKHLIYGYSYDKLNRLINADATVVDFVLENSSSAVSYQIGDESYSYDKIANITSLLRVLKNDDPTSGSPFTKTDHFNYQYTSGNNRLQQVNGLDGTVSRHYSYDGNGNMLTDDFKKINKTVYGRSSYTYEILKSDFTTGAERIEKINYLYDVNDSRIYKKVQILEEPIEKEEYYLNDAMGRSIAIFDIKDNNWSYFVFGTLREARIVPSANQKPNLNATNTDKRVLLSHATFFVYDHLENTRITYTPVDLKFIDVNTTHVVSRIDNVVDYFPYGKILREYVNIAGRERYLTTQHERDGETGMDYRGARYYDSDIGRFLSIDPLAVKYPALSSYNYVACNPIIKIDPNGKEIIIQSQWIDEKGGYHVVAMIYRNGQLYDNSGALYIPIVGGYMEKVRDDLNLLQTAAGERAKNVVDVLQNSKKTHTIQNDIRGRDDVWDRNIIDGNGTGSFTHYTPFVDQPLDLKENIPYKQAINKAIDLIHELTHAYDIDQFDPINDDPHKNEVKVNGIEQGEIHACSVENSVRLVLKEAKRLTYGKFKLPA